MQNQNKKMRIAILVWGSLFWDARNLSTTGEWFFDGPILPIEFSRISGINRLTRPGGNRLTLVITEGFDNVTTLYAISGFDNLGSAIENLGVRENTSNRSNIGYIDFENGTNNVRIENQFVIQILSNWNEHYGFDAIIWSDFASNFAEVRNQEFNLENAIEFINGLEPNDRVTSLQYMRNAPEQITARFRQPIIEHFSD